MCIRDSTAILPDLPDGAAVLIQKPMGADLDQARAIRAICRDKGLKAAVSFQLRFSPMMMVARAAIEAGMIGDPLELEVHLNIFTPVSYTHLDVYKRQDNYRV